MSDATVIVLGVVGIIPGTIAAIGALVLGILNYSRLNIVHTQIDGKMDELLRVSGREQKEIGRKLGVKQERSDPGNKMGI